MDYSEGYLPGHDQSKLFFRCWKALAENYVAIIIHGFGEHSGRYRHVVEALSQNGTCYLYDQRGHGLSEGRRGVIHEFDELSLDLREMLEWVSDRHPRTPIFLIGHSLGGLVILYSLLSYPYDVQGVVLSNPVLKIDVTVPLWKRLSVNLLSRWLPIVTLHNEIDFKALTRDQKMLDALNIDVYVHQRISGRFYTEMLRAMEFVYRQSFQISLPLLFLVGSEDKVVNPQMSYDFFKHIESKDKDLKIYKGYYHEIFNDIGREAVFKDLNQWLAEQVAREKKHAV